MAAIPTLQLSDMVCRAFQRFISVVELGIIKEAKHVCNGKAD